MRPCFYYSQKKSPAAGFYYLQNFKIDLLLLFTQNPPKFFSDSYYSHVKGGFIINSPVAAGDSGGSDRFHIRLFGVS